MTTLDRGQKKPAIYYPELDLDVNLARLTSFCKNLARLTSESDSGN